MLARRELSEAQVRERLGRKGFEQASIDLTLKRLIQEKAVDDQRTAVIYAHRSAHVKMQGRSRAIRELQHLGICRDKAEAAVSQVYDDLEEQVVLEKALSRRLKGSIKNQSELRRLYQYLLRQGFESSVVMSVLKKHSNLNAYSNRVD